MTTDPATVAPPNHPLHALTTYELSGYCRQLESALACSDGTDPAPPARTTCTPGSMP
jgi:hypothetical protein